MKQIIMKQWDKLSSRGIFEAQVLHLISDLYTITVTFGKLINISEPLSAHLKIGVVPKCCLLVSACVY